MIETTNEISARDRALAAWRAQQDEAAALAAEQERYTRRQDAQVFAQKLKQTFGVDLHPHAEELVYEFDETGIAVTLHRGDLHYVTACMECGVDTPAGHVWDWASLGAAIAEYEQERLKVRCPWCKAQHEEQQEARWHEERTQKIPVSETAEQRFFSALCDALDAAGFVRR